MLLAAAVCFLIYCLLPRRWNLRIRLCNGKVAVQGQAAAGKAAVIGNFFKDEFSQLEKAEVTGFWDGFKLRLWFQGFSWNDQQRIRNFLIDVL
jgi:hypothetical protein